MDGYKFKMGWMLVMFDLPVTTAKRRKHALEFRNFLLDEGYLMVQLSVYVRDCVSYNRMQTQMRRIKANLPPEGDVRAVYVTQAQWERMFIMHGPPDPDGNDPQPEEFPDQLLLF